MNLPDQRSVHGVPERVPEEHTQPRPENPTEEDPGRCKHCNASNTWPWGARRSKPPKPRTGTNRDESPPGGLRTCEVKRGVKPPRSLLPLAVATKNSCTVAMRAHPLEALTAELIPPATSVPVAAKVDGRVLSAVARRLCILALRRCAECRQRVLKQPPTVQRGELLSGSTTSKNMFSREGVAGA